MVPAEPCINVLNKSCETGHAFLAPVLWANIFNFSPFSGRQAAGLSNSCWGWDFCSFPPWLIETVDEEMTLTDDRFCGCGEDHTASVLHSANVSCQVCWFGNRNYSCISCRWFLPGHHEWSSYCVAAFNLPTLVGKSCVYIPQAYLPVVFLVLLCLCLVPQLC